jgi:membrane-associated protein
MHFDLVFLIKSVGLLGVWGIIFAESGLLVGFFLPGDSLIFTAGFLASQGYLNIWWLAIGGFVAAVLGDSVGYAFGKRVGPAIFKKEDSLFFNKANLQRAQNFYEAHGGKTIFLSRFIPVVRTFAPIVAGVGKMHYGKFLSWNVGGGFVWAVGMSVAGYFLGASVPNADKYVLQIVAFIIIISVAPAVWHLLKDKNTRQKLWHLLTRKKVGEN